MPARTAPTVTPSWMASGHLHGTADNDGLEHVAFDLPDDEDRREHGEQAGDRRADDRHVGAEEGQHRERERERHADYRDRRPDQHGVEEGHQRLAADEASGLDLSVERENSSSASGTGTATMPPSTSRAASSTVTAAGPFRGATRPRRRRRPRR
ncbi:MAG TPA: hypothetical protein VFX80_09870 [Solirubrobacteraceae bacterium]|nr:hypothetical protein [Solirubrobacteraceae bacterium]